MSEAIYYFLGVLSYVYVGSRPEKGEYLIELYQKNVEFLHYVRELLLRDIGVEAKLHKHRSKHHKLAVYSKLLFDTLSHEKTRLFKQTNTNQETAFVKGFVDAEGSVHKTLNRIAIWQKDVSVLLEIRKVLSRTGILCGAVTKSRNVYALNIYGFNNLVRFEELIGFRHPEKQRLLRRKVAMAQP